MELEQLEELALAEDREKALESLIPGTEPYYFHHALHLQRTGRFEEVPALVEQWVQRHHRSAKVVEIERRHALLTYDRDPQSALRFIKKELGLRHDHRQETEVQERSHPSALDPELITRERLLKRPRSKSDLSSFEPSALRWLPGITLTKRQQQHLLDQRDRPDHENLVQIILADLDDPKTGAFGTRQLHSRLLLTQLDELLSARPKLSEQNNFVMTYLRCLQPSPDEGWASNAEAQVAYLSRLWDFVKGLSESFNGLKAAILHAQLDLDRRHRRYDRARFLAYLALPRSVGYAPQKWLEKHRDRLVHLGEHFDALELPVVQDDEPLVRALIEHFVLENASLDDFAPYIKKETLLRWRAFAMIGAGIGDQERWYSELDDPAAYQRYRDRVDVILEPDNQAYFGRDDQVRLAVRVKNVKELLVKVFEINARNYFEQNGTGVDTSIDLDGLVAGEEQRITLDQSPLRVTRQEIELPSLAKPGVYVVEVIGNGKSSRALITKGQLRLLERNGAAGHVLSVIDEADRLVPHAKLWFGGREVLPDERGELLIPYGTEQRTAQVLLVADDVASVASFLHRTERYELQAGFFVDQEQLIRDGKAKLLVRAGLFLADTEVDLENLSDVRLTITSVDAEGTSSSIDLPEFQLSSSAEAVHEISVPDGLRSLSFRLAAKVRQLSTGQDQPLSVERTINANGIDATDRVQDTVLAETAAGYVLHLLGRTGEPLPDRPMTVTIKHRDFKETVEVALQTDADGRILLGHLPDVRWIRESTTGRRWVLEQKQSSCPRYVHAKEGEAIRLPWMVGRSLDAERVSLLEVRSGRYLRDCRQHVHAEAGHLILEGLSAGDYDLWLREGGSVQIRVGRGPRASGHVLSRGRILEARPRAQMAVRSIDDGAEGLKIQLSAFSSSSRVHVIGTSLVPERSAFSALGLDWADPTSWRWEPVESHYVSGRDIGDEYRYILERKNRKRFAGNMLARPGLLLNPWAVRKTDTVVDTAAEGEAYASMGGGGAARRPKPKKRAGRAQGAGASAGSSYDFLARPPVVLANLRPDEKGAIHVPAEALAGLGMLRVVAVDRDLIQEHRLLRPEQALETRDLRMARSLPDGQSFTQKKERTMLVGGAAFEVADITTAEMECVDTIGKAYSVLKTLSGDATLAEFSFAMEWSSLTPEEKQKKYSKYACHELHLFLSRKDPEFFARVIKPYLASKLDKTFLDHYLLGSDLSAYLEPWAYARLNVMEQILLGQRLDDDATRRYVKDRFDLLEKDVVAEDRLFKNILGKSALETGDSFGMKGARDELAKAMPPPMPMQAAPMRMRSAMPAGAAAPEPMEMAAMEVEEEMDFDDDESVMMAGLDRFEEDKKADLSRRDSVRPMFRQQDQTEEWAENNYYHRRIQEQVAELITVNAFWNDFAAHDRKGPFLTGNFAHATKNFAEMMCALALLDLPFSAEAHQVTYEGRKMALTASGPAVMLHREIKPAVPHERKIPILVSQNYFAKDDRFEWDGDEQREKYVAEEFLIHRVYVCQVVLTNPTSTRERLDLLLQIPDGAIPVENGFFTKGRPISLEAYATESVEYAFYFPAPGAFRHYPVQVSKNEALVVAAPFAPPLKVVAKPSRVDATSWAYVSQRGTLEEVEAFLEKANLERIDLTSIAWRMRDRSAFERVTRILSGRHRIDATLWSYAVMHGDVVRLAEYLRFEASFLNGCGGSLSSSLLNIDPIERHAYEHLAYLPLVNARAHRLGGGLKILNSSFSSQYRSFLEQLCYRGTRSSRDWLEAAYYLLLQDRVEEGLGALARVDANRVSTALQLDYLTAYAALYRQDLETARAAAGENADHPVDRWRHRFQSVIAILDEAADQTARVVDADDRDERQAQLASTEPSFELALEHQSLLITSRNLKTVTVNFYEMDIELLFSRHPFVQQEAGRFSMIRPGHTQEIQLDDDGTLRMSLPEALRQKNTIVEVVAAGKRVALVSYAHELSLQTAEQYGHLYVRQRGTEAPLPQAYVKVYAETRSGGVKFYKDGYTDVRGCFDYTSLSTSELDDVTRFALLVMSDEAGALIKEARPPQR